MITDTKKINEKFDYRENDNCRKIVANTQGQNDSLKKKASEHIALLMQNGGKGLYTRLPNGKLKPSESIPKSYRGAFREKHEFNEDGKKSLRKVFKVVPYYGSDDTIFNEDEEDSLGEELRRIIRETISTVGIEAIGWYISFRQGNAWGVYLLKEGIGFLAHEIVEWTKSKNVPMQFREARKVAEDYVLAHELAHYATDLWMLYEELRQIKVLNKKYRKYKKENFLTLDNTEETLCQLHAQDAQSHFNPGLEKYFEESSENLPEAYRTKGKTFESVLYFTELTIAGYEGSRSESAGVPSIVEMLQSHPFLKDENQSGCPIYKVFKK